MNTTIKNILLALIITVGGATALVAFCWAGVHFFIFITEKYGDHAVPVLMASIIGLFVFSQVFSHLQGKKAKK